MADIFQEIKKERERQKKLWGDKPDDRNTRNDWVAYICYYVSRGAYNGKDNEFKTSVFRTCLIKAAAICIAAVEAIDRNGTLPETEIQKLLNKG